MGWAMPIRALALSRVDFPLMVRGSVFGHHVMIVVPGGSDHGAVVQEGHDSGNLPIAAVEVMATMAFPPRLAHAPLKKSTCPPVPLNWELPMLSAQTCPVKSTWIAELMDTILLFLATTKGSFTYWVGYISTMGFPSTKS